MHHENKAIKLIKIDPTVYRLLRERIGPRTPTLNNVLRDLFGLGPSGVVKGPRPKVKQSA